MVIDGLTRVTDRAMWVSVDSPMCALRTMALPLAASMVGSERTTQERTRETRYVNVNAAIYVDNHIKEGEGDANMMKPGASIISIAPVTGWYAVYAVKPEENANNPVWTSPLALWALVQEETCRRVVGLDCTLAFCDQGDNFLGYLAPGEDPNAWKDDAVKFLQGRMPRRPFRSPLACRHPGQHP